MDDTMTAARFMALDERLGRIEDQLAILSERAGVFYERPTADGVPASVRALAAAGRRDDAIMELRRLKPVSLAEAKMIVEGL